MSGPFNPYREWLQLPVDDGQPNHYALLGLARFETDPARIQAAADSRLNRVLSQQPADHVEEWQKLVGELAIARQTLSDPQTKQAYDAKLQQQSRDIPVAKRAAAEHATLKAPQPATRPLDPSAARSTASLAAAQRPEKKPPSAAVDDWLPPKAIPAAGPNSSPPPGPTNTAQRLPYDFLPPVSVAQSADPFAANPGGSFDSIPLPLSPAWSRPPIAVEPLPHTPAIEHFSPGGGLESAFDRAPLPEKNLVSGRAQSAAQRLKRQRRTRNWLVAVAILLFVGGAALTVASLGGWEAISRRWSRRADAHDLAANGTESSPPQANSSQPADSPADNTVERDRPAPPPPSPPRQQDPPVQPQPLPPRSPPVSQADPPPAPPTPPKTTPSVPNPTPVSPVAPDPQQAANFRAALLEVRTSLGARNLDQAKKQLQTAQAAARTDEQKSLAASMVLVADYVRQFWEAVGQGWDNAETADELKIGTTVAVVVSRTPSQIEIKTAEFKRSYKKDSLPPGLAIGLANTWFDQRPENKVLLGAFRFVDRGSKPADAEALWRQAAADGVDTTPLLPLLQLLEPPRK